MLKKFNTMQICILNIYVIYIYIYIYIYITYKFIKYIYKFINTKRRNRNFEKRWF